MSKSLSPASRAAFSILGVIACLASHPALAQGTAEQQAACAGDAFSLCRGEIPNVAKITACMGAHKAELSPKCRAVYDAATEPKAEPPKASERPVERKSDSTKAVEPKSVTNETVTRETETPKQAKARATSTKMTKTTTTKTTAIQTTTPTKVAARKVAARKKVETQTVEAPAPRSPETPLVPDAPRGPAAPPPPAPAPESNVPGLDSYRASIATSCAQGLIDPYTCRSTLEMLKGTE